MYNAKAQALDTCELYGVIMGEKIVISTEKQLL